MTRLMFGALLGALALLGCARPQTYSETCNKPLPNWRTPGDGWHNIVTTNLAIAADDSLSWNGKAVEREELQRYLTIIPTVEPTPGTILSVHPSASCAMVGVIRTSMERALNCRETRRCGEGDARGDWDAPPFVDVNSSAYKQALDDAERAVEEADNASGN